MAEYGKTSLELNKDIKTGLWKTLTLETCKMTSFQIRKHRNQTGIMAKGVNGEEMDNGGVQ